MLTTESSEKDKVGIQFHFPTTSPCCFCSVLKKQLEGSVDTNKEGWLRNVGGTGAFRETLILLARLVGDAVVIIQARLALTRLPIWDHHG